MQILEAGSSPVQSLAFTSDSEVLAAGTLDGSVRVWDSGGHMHVQIESVAGGAPNALVFQPESPWLCIADGPEVGCMNLATQETFRIPVPMPGATTGLAFVKPELLAVGTGKRAAAGTGGYFIYDWPKRTVRKPIQNEPHGVRALVTLPAQSRVIWTTGNNLLRWASLSKPGFLEARLGKSASSLAIPADGQQAAMGIDWEVRVFDLSTKLERQLPHPIRHRGQVTGVGYSHDSRTLASGSWDETVRLSDAATGQERKSFALKIGKIMSLCFSPDGSRLAAGSDRGLVAVWDLD